MDDNEEDDESDGSSASDARTSARTTAYALPHRPRTSAAAIHSARRRAVVAAAHAAFEQRHDQFLAAAQRAMAHCERVPSASPASPGHLAWGRALTQMRRNRLVWVEPERLDEAQSDDGWKRQRAGWDMKRSIWWPRASYSDSRSVYDTESVVQRRFDRDWPCALHLGVPSAIQKFGTLPEAETPAAALAAAVASVADVLVRTFDVWWHTFSYYASLNGELEHLTLNTWSQLLVDCKLVDERSELCSQSALDTLFIEVDALGAREFPSSRQKALSRLEFMAALVRLAINRHVRAKREPEPDVARALTRLVEDVARRVDGGLIAPPNAFRRRIAYLEPVDKVLRANEASLRALFTCLARLSPYGGERLLSFPGWLEFLREVELLGADLPER